MAELTPVLERMKANTPEEDWRVFWFYLGELIDEVYNPGVMVEGKGPGDYKWKPLDSRIYAFLDYGELDDPSYHQISAWL
jgi:hypothetical protein